MSFYQITEYFKYNMKNKLLPNYFKTHLAQTSLVNLFAGLLGSLISGLRVGVLLSAFQTTAFGSGTYIPPRPPILRPPESTNIRPVAELKPVPMPPEEIRSIQQSAPPPRPPAPAPDIQAMPEIIPDPAPPPKKGSVATPKKQKKSGTEKKKKNADKDKKKTKTKTKKKSGKGKE